MYCYKWIVTGKFILIALWFTTNLAETSGEEFKVEKISPDPVFVELGQPLKLEINIPQLYLETWNMTAFWTYFPNHSSNSEEHNLQLLRNIGKDYIFHHAYDPRVTVQRQADLVLVNTTVADTGVYQCRFRRPPNAWETLVKFHVTIEGKKVLAQKGSPKPIYVATGDTLKLNTMLNNPEVYNSSKRGPFWDFRAVLPYSKKHAQSVRVIGVHGGSIKRYDLRASLEGIQTLTLKNARSNDSGVYSYRIFRTAPNRLIRVDFNVIVQDKPKAELTCPKTIALTVGEDFSCLCKAIVNSPNAITQASWIKGGQLVKTEGNSSQQELSLRNFQKTMAGTYICRANVATLIDEQSIKITVIQTAGEVKKCLEKRFGFYLLLGTGIGGLLLGVIATVGFQRLRRKIRNIHRYEEPIEVKSTYQELDVKKMKSDEPFYQPLQRNTKKTRC